MAVAPDPSPTRDDCRFTGWQYDGKSYDFGSKVTGDITLTAQWVRTAHQWTITFDLNGGHAPAGKDAKTLYAERKSTTVIRWSRPRRTSPTSLSLTATPSKGGAR